jgi:hypothetical protein
VLGHPRNHPHRLEALPEEVLRVDQERLAERFPGGPPPELLQAAAAAMAGGGFALPPGLPLPPGIESPDDINMDALQDLLGSIPTLVGAMESGIGASCG